jgi:hypothetical protein
VVGKAESVPPEHIDGTVEKEGVIATDGFTVIVKVVFVAHVPGVGLNVYVDIPATAVLTTGDHIPAIEFVEIVGKTGGVKFTQRSGIGVNVGSAGVLIVVIFNVALAAH